MEKYFINKSKEEKSTDSTSKEVNQIPKSR